MHLKVKHDGPLANFAFKFDLRRYTKEVILARGRSRSRITFKHSPGAAAANGIFTTRLTVFKVGRCSLTVSRPGDCKPYVCKPGVCKPGVCKPAISA
jgi:hypothetical protein